MDSVPFKPRAYEKASEIVGELAEGVDSIYKRGGLKALEKIPGVGASLAEKIEEFIKTKKIRDYAELKKKTPVELFELLAVEGLGPKKIKALYKELNIRNIADLKKAVEKGKIRKLDGFGEKSEENIKRRLLFLEGSGGRFILGAVEPILERIQNNIKEIPGVTAAEIAGSYRRRKDTIGDGDILVISEEPKVVMDYFVKMEDVAEVLAHGDTKSAVKLKNGLNVDVRVLEPESYGAALMYFTGSKDHNIALRELAINKGLKLNEYGLFQDADPRGFKHRSTQKEIMVAGKTEEEIYKHLGLDYIEPEMRENRGEIDLARNHKLPKLIEAQEVRGDLQVQTNWTDGENSIFEMAEEAMRLGREYILITDHTKRLAMANGLDEKRILKQMEEIDAINLKFKSSNLKFRILRGTECDILKDGELDLPDYILEQLDIVGASVHSQFNLSSEDQTKRVKKAMANKNVDILFHPTGRVLNKRDAYAIDMEEIISFAKKTGTILEINAFPQRADLKDEYIKKCVEIGVKMSVDSDAHSTKHLSYIDYGVYQARRGWATKEDIINAWPLEKMLSFLKK